MLALKEGKLVQFSMCGQHVAFGTLGVTSTGDTHIAGRGKLSPCPH